MGLEVDGCAVDVTERVKVEEAVQRAALAFGGVDALVSNAGIVVQAKGIASVCPAPLFHARLRRQRRKRLSSRTSCTRITT